MDSVSPAFIDSRARAPVVVGVRVDALTKADLHSRILRTCTGGAKALVLHANAHAINLSRTDNKFREVLNSADCVFCDGAGVRLAAAIAGHNIPERITYADWTWEFAEFCEAHNLSWYLLGGAEGRAARAADAVRARFPKLRIVGTRNGYFDRTPNSVANERVVAEINESGADILIVGFGMPVQEHWYAENWRNLNVRVGLTGGAVFDYVSGELRRPARLFRAVGMEWLGRLLIEPARLWRRYVIGNPVFLARAVWSGLIGRARSALLTRSQADL